MNRHFHPTSRRTRATFAIAAALVSLLIGTSIDGLADHYQTAPQLASQTPLVVAQH
jgi:hypothetical protein